MRCLSRSNSASLDDIEESFPIVNYFIFNYYVLEKEIKLIFKFESQQLILSDFNITK